MLIVQNSSIDPYFNIAAEEYLLKNFSEDILMLYVNKPSIILGKHQNALAEINYPYVHQNKVPVVRRLSGGGTVYHDWGNLNFTFLRNAEAGHLVNFKKFTNPVMQVLQQYGVNVCFEGKNDLRIDGLKISGNAEHVFKNRVLHHGTLLFDSDLSALGEAIKVRPNRYYDKAVQSVRSKVTNIKPYFNADTGIQDFKNMIEEHIRSTEPASDYSFSEKDKKEIKKLQKEKYQHWEWIYGYSPKYVLKTTIEWQHHKTEVEIACEKAIINAVSARTENRAFDFLFQALPGTPHAFENIRRLVIKHVANASEKPDQLTYQFF